MAEPLDDDAPQAIRPGDPQGPPPMPAGLSDAWPVPWQPVWGPDDGWSARAAHRLLRAVLALATRLPEPWLAPLLGALARVARRVDRRHAAAARAFLRQAVGPLEGAELERRVLQAYRHFFGVVLDAERFSRRVPPQRVAEHFEVVWTDDARRALAAGKGCVLVTAHVGNWELGTAVAPWLGFDPLYAVAKPPKNRRISQEVQRSREERGVRLLPRRGAMQDAGTVLRAGGHLAMLLDQRARKRPVLAPFFGRPARCDRSAGVLLRRLGAPLVFVAVPRIGPLRYRFEFVEVLWPEDLAGLDPVAIATRVNGVLERMIRAWPDQYFWLHDRYRDTPARFEEERPPLVGEPAAASNGPQAAGEES